MQRRVVPAWLWAFLTVPVVLGLWSAWLLLSRWSLPGLLAALSAAFALLSVAVLLSRQRAIVEQRGIEERLTRQRNIVQSVFDNMGEGVAVADEAGRFLQFNPKAEEILGMGATESDPQRWSQIYGLFELDRVTPIPPERLPLARAIAGEPSHNREMFVRNPSLPGGVFISVTATPLKDRNGALRGGIAVFRDITERKETEAARQVRDLAAHLQAAREKERSQIAIEIHDELGQALTGMKLELSYITRRADGPLRQGLEKMALQIDATIVAVRRIAADLRPRILDELGLVEACRWHIREFGARSNIDCIVRFPEEEIACDRDRATALFRILQESLTNVARHAEAKHVTVSLDGQDGFVSLEVRDDGRGIQSEHVASARSFGLLGMRERARMFGGVLTVESAADEGTTVRARLPLEPQSSRPAAEA